jgi:hypothetical protein
MKVTIKLRFNSSKSKWENFGSNRYLVYLLSGKEQGAQEELYALISRHLGIPENKISYLGKDSNGDAIFEI